MRVEAVKQKDGWFIPMAEEFEFIGKDRIIMDIAILTSEEEKDYQVLDQIIGLCDSGRSDASVHHDIYRKIENKWPDNFFKDVVGGWSGDLVRPEQRNFEVREEI